MNLTTEQIEQLKKAASAEAANAAEWVNEEWAEKHFGSPAEGRFVALASPQTIRALIDELESLRTLANLKAGIEEERRKG